MLLVNCRFAIIFLLIDSFSAITGCKNKHNCTVPDLIKSDGYKVELHKVKTEDGYILEMHRIPGKRGSPAVMLQHGLICSSAVWVFVKPKRSLAYLLADEGYDVWMANSRGNPYSRKHVTLSPDSKDKTFWQFSWHEIGVYDMPAQIDYILHFTRQNNLFVVAHSQGNTAFFVMASERPEYNAKVKAMFALSPVVYFKHALTPLVWSSLIYKGLTFMHGHGEFFGKNSFYRGLVNKFCRDGGVILRFICLKTVFILSGHDREQLRGVAESGVFRQYDHGKKENLNRYGRATPPKYNLRNVTSPVLVYYSENDYFLHVKDADLLYSEIGNPFCKYKVKYRWFNHGDFIWARDVKSLVYKHLLEKMRMFILNGV